MLTEEQIKKMSTKEKLMIATAFMKEVIKESHLQNKNKMNFLVKRLNDMFKELKVIKHIEVKADDKPNK